MSSESEEYLAYMTHMRAEHKRLRECVLRIEEQWPFQHEPPRQPDVSPLVIESLGALRADLAHHFEEEESGGCLEEAVSRQPNLSRDANRLEHEHPELLEQIDRMIEGLQALSRPAASTAKIKQDFRAFTEKLLAHEAAENRILKESFGIEVD